MYQMGGGGAGGLGFAGQRVAVVSTGGFEVVRAVHHEVPQLLIHITHSLLTIIINIIHPPNHLLLAPIHRHHPPIHRPLIILHGSNRSASSSRNSGLSHPFTSICLSSSACGRRGTTRTPSRAQTLIISARMQSGMSGRACGFSMLDSQNLSSPSGSPWFVISSSAHREWSQGQSGPTKPSGSAAGPRVKFRRVSPWEVVIES
jgi:hypothetical protein